MTRMSRRSLAALAVLLFGTGAALAGIRIGEPEPEAPDDYPRRPSAEPAAARRRGALARDPRARDRRVRQEARRGGDRQPDPGLEIGRTREDGAGRQLHPQGAGSDAPGGRIDRFERGRPAPGNGGVPRAGRQPGGTRAHSDPTRARSDRGSGREGRQGHACRGREPSRWRPSNTAVPWRARRDPTAGRLCDTPPASRSSRSSPSSRGPVSTTSRITAPGRGEWKLRCPRPSPSS